MPISQPSNMPAKPPLMMETSGVKPQTLAAWPAR